MFEHPLPTTIKPVKLARKEGKLVGYMPLKQLTALVADCATDDGRVEADLALHMNGARPEIHGTAKAALQLVCQRCLEPVEVEIDIKVALGVAQTEEQVNQMPGDLEPFMLEEEEIPLASLLEQELILALPIVAYHEKCKPFPYEGSDGGEAEASEKPNPFAVLEQLKGNVKNSD
ncbi:hypothetical protein FT643_00915 [Ketobacter sp. MCCC 1A13808]|uniref:YceD family protein n=1 Tax=Ketobacter sp. MCCC 1A13808 TaxID=2602738 RepID=UPI000F12991A|nr:YceD family protein [Ketobacter sp. MCCC 1A13808]MVF10690.1 hypothetical protein [Ketobacter sp. MCCC 1A13808]RLP56108.1 MAG: hypothetical protein D6160_01540 [Ketobacter sp.]